MSEFRKFDITDMKIDIIKKLLYSNNINIIEYDNNDTFVDQKMYNIFVSIYDKLYYYKDAIDDNLLNFLKIKNRNDNLNYENNTKITVINAQNQITNYESYILSEIIDNNYKVMLIHENKNINGIELNILNKSSK